MATSASSAAELADYAQVDQHTAAYILQLEARAHELDSRLLASQRQLSRHKHHGEALALTLTELHNWIQTEAKAAAEATVQARTENTGLNQGYRVGHIHGRDEAYHRCRRQILDAIARIARP